MLCFVLYIPTNKGPGTMEKAVNAEHREKK